MNILGINYGGHDTSACIISKGKILAACEQERYDKIKHSRNFPIDAVNDCLKISELNISDIDIVSYGLDIKAKINNLYLKPIIQEPARINLFFQDIKKLYENENIEKYIRKKLNFKKKIDFVNHHLCHLASAYYVSKFKKSLVTSYDGVGEFNSALFGLATNGKIRIVHDKNVFPDSLGLFYSAITFYLGWKHHCDEGIIMGLAPYGNPHAKVNKLKFSYIQLFRKIINQDKKDPLLYKVNREWISYNRVRDKWVSDLFINTFGKKREYNHKLKQHHKNIAAALQLRLEEIVLSQLSILKKKFKAEYLCIAGGVGLNCSLNGKISEKKIFKKIFIQPASGDSGVAVGAALVSYFKYNKNMNKKFNDSAHLGYVEKSNNIKKILDNNKAKYSYRGDKIYEDTAKFLYEGKVVGWFQGQAEFGPRALGNRSILCKPFPIKMKDHLNKNVKFREVFRPFAPSVLEENLHEYFNINQKSEHMLIACKVKKNKKKTIPAVVHVDDTCRVQSVSKNKNERFWKLISEFKKLSNIPVLLNTSFNIKGQPIVNDIEDALKCFKKYKIDILIVDKYLIKK